MQNDYNQAESELNLARMKMKERDSEINKILMEQQKLKHKLTDINLQKKRMENDVIIYLDFGPVMLMTHGCSLLSFYC